MQHLYFDVSDLNAPYDSIPLRGVEGLAAGSLSGNSLVRGRRSLGDWVSDKNCKHSGDYNACDNQQFAAAQQDCYAVDDYAKLGFANFDDCVQRSYTSKLRYACEQYCPGPTAAGTKKKTSGGPPPVTTTKCPEGQFADASGKCVPIPPRRSAMGGGKAWIIGGAVVAAVAVGGAVWYKMLKRR